MTTESGLTLEQVLEVFAAGFTFTRSVTHPYRVEKIAPHVWRLFDGPRRTGAYRGEEIVAFGVEPGELDALARHTAAGPYSLCYLVPVGVSDTPVREAWKACGCRLRGTEALMVHGLEPVPAVASDTRFPTIRVQTEEQMASLARAMGRRPLPPALWKAEDAPLRQYFALDGETVVGWVGSVQANVACGANQAAWCSSLFVAPTHRRRGIATALLAHMLRDDKASGATANVLLASHAGAKLYPTLGYQTLGTLLLYKPAKPQPTAPE